MQFQYTIDDKNQLAVVTLEGEFNVEEYLCFYRELMLNKKIEKIKAIIWDSSELKVGHVTTNDISFLIKHIKQTSEKRKGGKAAWVVKDTFGFGMGRMFEMMSEEEIHIIVKVFYNVDDAKKWTMET